MSRRSDKPLSSWTFRGDYAGNRLRYYPGRVEVDVVHTESTTYHSQIDTVESHSYQTHQTRTYTPRQVFESLEPIATLEVEHQLLKAMVDTVGTEELDERRRCFWQDVDEDRILQRRLNAGDRTCLEITRWGAWLHENRRRRSTRGMNPHQQRFDQCFFDGPAAYGLSFADRAELRSCLFEALGPDTSLSIGDGYPLFDYDRTPTSREWRQEDGYVGASLELQGDRVIIAGWDNPRDGGAIRCSIENFWSNPVAMLERLVGGRLNRHVPQALSLLEAAIVKKA